MFDEKKFTRAEERAFGANLNKWIQSKYYEGLSIDKITKLFYEHGAISKSTLNSMRNGEGTADTIRACANTIVRIECPHVTKDKDLFQSYVNNKISEMSAMTSAMIKENFKNRLRNEQLFRLGVFFTMVFFWSLICSFINCEPEMYFISIISFVEVIKCFGDSLWDKKLSYSTELNFSIQHLSIVEKYSCVIIFIAKVIPYKLLSENIYGLLINGLYSIGFAGVLLLIFHYLYKYNKFVTEQKATIT